MKVSIIRIKAQDTLNIIADSLKNALNQRVFMILPEGNDVLYSEIGLETLFKKALEAGKELVVSVPDQRSMDLAQKVGLVATTEQDVFTMDYKLWQKAHELLVNYKTHALYDKKYATNPNVNIVDKNKNSDNNQMTPDITNVSTDSEPKKLVGLDFSPKVGGLKGDKTQSKRMLHINKNKSGLILPSNKGSRNVKHNKTKKGINVKLIIGLILFSLVSILGILFWIYYRFLTKVYVYFTLPRTTIEKTYTLTGELGIEGSILASKKFALKEYIKEVNGHLTSKATQKQIDGTYAKGVVVVTNNGTSPIDITVGMIFTSGDKQFKSTNAATIEPGSTANISVQAVDYGDSYNLAANQVFTIQGLTQAYSATNPAAFSGGSLREYTVVSQKEVDQTIKDLKQQLLDQAKEGIEDVYKDDNYIFVPGSIRDITSKDTKFTVDPKVGEEATEFTVQGAVKIRALYYHEPSLQALLKQLLINDYKKSKKLDNNVVIKLEEFTYDITKIKVVDDKHVQFIVHTKASVVPSVDFDSLKNKVVNVDLQTLKNRIEEDYNSLILNYRIVYIPDWMPEFLRKVPSSPNRLIIVVDYKEQK